MRLRVSGLWGWCVCVCGGSVRVGLVVTTAAVSVAPYGHVPDQYKSRLLGLYVSWNVAGNLSKSPASRITPFGK